MLSFANDFEVGTRLRQKRFEANGLGPSNWGRWKTFSVVVSRELESSVYTEAPTTRFVSKK